jgi:NNP family nitrate/nitrite transporter-like MFS transporter
MREALGLRITWQAAALYAIAFGGYVAFSVYLPTYLKNAYGLTPADASNRMAGFVVVAVVMRPVGGWLSDRVRAGSVLMVAFAVVALDALIQSSTPDLSPVGTIVFLTMAAALGTATGATFALLAQRAPAAQVGAVTGIVGAAGGLGGFFPPLVMGATYDSAGNDYTTGLALLSLVSLLALLYTAWRLPGRSQKPAKVSTPA